MVSGTYDTDPGLYLYHFGSGKVTRLAQYITSGYVGWARK